jgi:hypothetical protein
VTRKASRSKREGWIKGDILFFLMIFFNLRREREVRGVCERERAKQRVTTQVRPGDVIKATFVSEVGLLNLVKIRKNAFEGGEDVVVEEDSDGDS